MTTPNSSTIRSQICRARRRAGLRCITVQMRDLEVDALVRRGLLAAGDRGDRVALAVALEALLDGIGALPNIPPPPPFS